MTCVAFCNGDVSWPCLPQGAVCIATSTPGLGICIRPEGADTDADGVPSPQDCDDSNPAINPNMPETCDGLDNNCDGAIDEGAVCGGGPVACSLFPQAGCGEGEACYAVASDGTVACLRAGRLAPGSACETSSNCAPPADCRAIGESSRPVCVALCDPTASSSSCLAKGTSCRETTAPGPGMCLP